MNPSDPAPQGGSADRAAEALDAVGADPRRARDLAVQAYTLARQERNASAASTALRAQGLAFRALGDLMTAEAKMRAAIRTSSRLEDAQPAGEARMSLAFILLERGKVSSALRHADRAADNLVGLPAARLIAQRAMILQRCGRLDEALIDFAKALPILRRHQDDQWEAVLRNNRGLLLVYRGDLAAAERDLNKALELDQAAGREVDAAVVEWNLGFLAARLGDAPAALERYRVAAAAHDRHGTPHPQLLMDRCEVLLSVGLTTEAKESAQLALAACATSGKGVDLAEAELLFAKAALADGDAQAAREAASRAEKSLRRQHRHAWALLARYVRLRADSESGNASRRGLASTLATADALGAAGWRVAELDARLVAARMALRLGDVTIGGEQLRRAARARSSTDLEVQTRAWYAEALLRHSSGDSPGSQAALRAGLRGIERQRSMLGATELRVHVASHGSELARMGLGLALASGSASNVLAWAERWRAGALHMRPVRPPRDPGLAAAVAELRRMSAEVDDALLDGERPRGLEARRRELELQIVRASRSTAGTHATVTLGPPSLSGLRAELGDRALVEYAEVAGSLVAVTVNGRSCRLFQLGPLSAITAELDSLAFALRRLAFGFGSDRSQRLARTAAELAAQRLDQLILGPLRPALGGAALVIVPTGALHAVPWAALPTSDAVPVAVAPSSAVWLRAMAVARPQRPRPGQRRGASPPVKVLLAAGPGLAAADLEIDTVATGYHHPTVLVGAAATGAAVLAALDGASLAHVSAHGRLRTDNPLFSALQLSDGDLTVYDLERLETAPITVLLPACQSGVAAVRAGDEVMGLVSALLSLGSRNVVATVIAVPDAPTAELMLGVHAELRRGAEPATALFTARHVLDRSDPATYAAAAGCVAYGA